MGNPKRKRQCRPAGEVVITKKAVTSDSLEDGGKLNPAQSGRSGVRPSGKPEKIRIIDIEELRRKAMELPDAMLDLPKDTAAAIFKGDLPAFDDHSTGRFLITSEGSAVGIMELEKGSVSALARFSEPLAIDKSYSGGLPKKIKAKKQELNEDTPIEGLPIQDLLSSHWDIHIMWTLRMINKDHPRVKDMSPEDIVNVHARIVDALKFRGVEHPQPPDNGLDMFSFDLERFAATQPRHFQRPESGGQIPLVKAIDPYLDMPREDGTYRFVAQNHYAGFSVHTDLRFGFKPDEMLLGWELQTIPPQAQLPVDSLKDAREASMDPKGNLINWDDGAWKVEAVAAHRRPQHPWVWLDVQGKTIDPDPESGLMAPGSGWEHPGVFYIVDRGEVEFGLQTFGAHEYFIKGLVMNYRVVMKSVPWREMDAVEEKARAVTKGSTEVANLPPEDEHLGERVDWSTGPWVAVRESSPRPMVLSKASPMPQDGFSALPKAVRSQIPPKFMYWTLEGDAAREQRDQLVDAIAAGAVAIDFAATFKKPVEKRSLATARFVVQDWTADGQWMTPHSHQIRVDVGRDEHLVLKVEQDKTVRGLTTGACDVSGEPRRDMMDIDGELRPSHHLNLEKQVTYGITKVDEGEATVMSLTDGFIRISFRGEKLNRTIDVRKQGDEWVMIGSGDDSAPLIKAAGPEDFVNILKFDGEDEERLVTGIVLEPDEIDTQNDTIKEAAIKATAHDFLAKFNKESELGVQHQMFGSIGVELVESYVTLGDMEIGGEKVKKGSWVITVKVVSDRVWKAIKSGDLTGFSIGGIATVV